MASEQLLNLNMTSNTTPSPFIASSSSVLSSQASRLPWKCFNNIIDGSSCFHSDSEEVSYVQIYLGKPYIISKCVFNLRSWTGSYNKENLIIYGSNNNSNFTKISSINCSSWSINNNITVNLNNINAYTHYRFSFISTSSHYTTINEISLYYKEQNMIIKTSNNYIGGE